MNLTQFQEDEHREYIALSFEGKLRGIREQMIFLNASHTRLLESLRKQVQELPDTMPLLESDYYDRGLIQMKKLVLAVLTNKNLHD